MSRCRSQIGSDKLADFKKLGFKPRPTPSKKKKKKFFWPSHNSSSFIRITSLSLILACLVKVFLHHTSISETKIELSWDWTISGSLKGVKTSRHLTRRERDAHDEGGVTLTTRATKRSNEGADKSITSWTNFILTRSRLSGNFQDTERPSWAGCEFFPMKGVDGRDFRASPKFQWGVGFRHWNRTDQLFLHPLSFFSLRIFSQGLKKGLRNILFLSHTFPFVDIE